METALAPTNIQTIGQELAIAWNDGRESYFSLESLRKSCPCAACGGEPDILGRVERPPLSYGPKSFALRGFKVVGGYAVQPTWDDGHDSGLYTFKYLRQLDNKGKPA
jgi:DUF971 family protein